MGRGKGECCAGEEPCCPGQGVREGSCQRGSERHERMGVSSLGGEVVLELRVSATQVMQQLTEKVQQASFPLYEKENRPGCLDLVIGLE